MVMPPVDQILSGQRRVGYLALAQDILGAVADDALGKIEFDNVADIAELSGADIPDGGGAVEIGHRALWQIFAVAMRAND
jgi:hypothetical protein